jgi:hypothetical protein
MNLVGSKNYQTSCFMFKTAAHEALLSNRSDLSQDFLRFSQFEISQAGASFLALFNLSQPSLVIAILHSIQTTNHILLKSAFMTSIKRP